MADTKPRLTHIALRVRDLDRTVAFYERFAGLGIAHERIDDGKRVVWLAERPTDPSFVFVLIPMSHTADERPSVHHFGFALASRDAVDGLARAADADGLLRVGPKDGGAVVGYFCVIEDPDGTWVEFSFGQPIDPRALPS